MDRAKDQLASENSYTVAAYENCAIDYAQSTMPDGRGGEPPALVELLRATGAGCSALEIGSGPGWDADWLEQKGLSIRRTDAAASFVDFQRARGKSIDRLDVVHDDLGGPYAAIIALYVFQHIDRAALPGVLARISVATAGGGVLLFSLREGESDMVETGTSGAHYYVAMWQKSDLTAILASLGFHLIWSSSDEGSEGRWLTMLCRKDDAIE